MHQRVSIMATTSPMTSDGMNRSEAAPRYVLAHRANVSFLVGFIAWETHLGAPLGERDV